MAVRSGGSGAGRPGGRTPAAAAVEELSRAERRRLATDHAAWMRWGPYLAERSWGTVREDYSPDGDAWGYLSHDDARSRAYRWTEDGLAGICDDRQRLCLALALWNGRDPILKERLFSPADPRTRRGAGPTEYRRFADAVPSHAYLRWCYAYPLDGYPYQALVEGDAAREAAREAAGDAAREAAGDADGPAFGLADTGVLDPEPGGVDGSARWADVTVEYAKAGPDDIVMRVRVANRSVRPATVHVLPTLWFRNTWAWGPGGTRGVIVIEDGLLVARHATLGTVLLAASAGPDGAAPVPLFCDNDTNVPRVFRAPATTPWPKDGINDHVVHGRSTVNPALVGTKAALAYRFDLAGREAAEIVVRLVAVPDDGVAAAAPDLADGARAVLAARRAEADAFHACLLPASATPARRAALRPAVARLIWGKCFYAYDVDTWLDGDPYPPRPPAERRSGRNRDWRHLRAGDVLSVPDPWTSPWLRATDLAFHAVALAHVDPRYAKDQLLLLTGDRYQHPTGQLPADEPALGAPAPPLHAWAALRVFETDGGTDRDFLERVLHKLLLNVAWWLNRTDLGAGHWPPGRSADVAWLAVYCLDLQEICLRLAAGGADSYRDLATTFAGLAAAGAAALRGRGPCDGEGSVREQLARVLGGRPEFARRAAAEAAVAQATVSGAVADAGAGAEDGVTAARSTGSSV